MRTCPSCQKKAPDEAGFCPNCGAQYPVGTTKGGMSAKTAAILVVAICIPLLVLCLGIVSAIAVPNLLDATNRARQKRAVGELRSLATAIQAFETDKASPPIPMTSEEGAWVEVPISEVEGALAPDYIQVVPTTDPWGKPYLYGFYTGPEGSSFYLLSLGRDGARDLNAIPDVARPTSCYESDILWAGSEFMQYPDGKQRVCGESAAADGSGR